MCGGGRSRARRGDGGCAQELKRIRNPLSEPDDRAADSSGVISRVASGLCIDFARDDPSIYYAGTEDGNVHKCRVSYNEQYLDTISAHAGPINRLRVSPFTSTALLTASADWTVRLWDTAAPGSEATTYAASSVSDGVMDVAWSPVHSTLFASVSGDGHVQLWDAAKLTPIVDHLVTYEGDAPSGGGAEAAPRPPTADAKASAAAAKAGVAAAAEPSWSRRASGDAPASAPAPVAAATGTRAVPPPAAPARTGPKRLSCVLFAPAAPVLLTGDGSGRVRAAARSGCSARRGGGGGVRACDVGRAFGRAGGRVSPVRHRSAAPYA